MAVTVTGTMTVQSKCWCPTRARRAAAELMVMISSEVHVVGQVGRERIVFLGVVGDPGRVQEQVGDSDVWVQGGGPCLGR